MTIFDDAACLLCTLNRIYMSELFKQHLQKFIAIDEEKFNDVLSFFELKTVKKKENVLVEGQVCKFNYFVLNGCMRMFFINEKGVEHTTQFAIENWWITDNMAYEHQLQTEFYIQAVEDTRLLTLHAESQEKLLSRYPEMERYFRYIYQRAYAASQRRIKYMYDFSREELYNHFQLVNPQFVQRIPQYLIASYLGFTPEYLSEIRRKKRT